MNKIRGLGLGLLVVGVILHFFFKNDGTDFLTGLLLGGGAGLLISGQIGMKSKNK